MQKNDVLLAYKNKLLDRLKDDEILKLIRKKYSTSDEIAILFRGTAEQKAEHEAYVEECKRLVQIQINSYLEDLHL